MSETNNIAQIEQALVFACEAQHLVGVLHAPEGAHTGLIMVSGGDQYRVGSHRMFVELARTLANAGIAVMRFDHRGIGDTAGNYMASRTCIPIFKRRL